MVKHHFSEKDVAYFLDIDFVNHVALVALASEGGKTAIVGSGWYIVLDAGRAEASFAVIDEYQGQGVGSALMRDLAGLGRQAGLRELVAEVLAENAAMLKVFEKSGLETSARREGPYVHVNPSIRVAAERSAAHGDKGREVDVVARIRLVARLLNSADIVPAVGQDVDKRAAD